jgi:hypothetical protein
MMTLKIFISTSGLCLLKKAGEVGFLPFATPLPHDFEGYVQADKSALDTKKGIHTGNIKIDRHRHLLHLLLLK